MCRFIRCSKGQQLGPRIHQHFLSRKWLLFERATPKPDVLFFHSRINMRTCGVRRFRTPPCVLSRSTMSWRLCVDPERGSSLTKYRVITMTCPTCSTRTRGSRTEAICEQGFTFQWTPDRIRLTREAEVASGDGDTSLQRGGQSCADWPFA